MKTKHNFVHLAEVQRQQGTMYCAGLDIHPFGDYARSLDIYRSVVGPGKTTKDWEEVKNYYSNLLSFSVFEASTRLRLSFLLSSIELYLIKVVDILVSKCNIRVFKLQIAFYEQFGPAGLVLLSRVTRYLRDLEIDKNIKLILIIDSKRGDIDTTQAAYLSGLMGNMFDSWGVDYSPYNFDIMNVTPWMGNDVLCLGTPEKPGVGLNLMNQGKGLIVVNKSSNPSGPQYQGLSAYKGILDDVIVNELGYLPVHMHNVIDLNDISSQYDLEYDGLSAIGLVVGSTHACDGGIRAVFPAATLLVPGFGAQGGKFSLIMPELIRHGKYVGQGAIFSSSRGTMYPWMKNLGGSDNVSNLENDLITAINKFRINEKEAFAAPEVQEMGITYPFAT